MFRLSIVQETGDFGWTFVNFVRILSCLPVAIISSANMDERKGVKTKKNKGIKHSKHKNTKNAEVFKQTRILHFVCILL